MTAMPGGITLQRFSGLFVICKPACQTNIANGAGINASGLEEHRGEARHDVSERHMVEGRPVEFMLQCDCQMAAFATPDGFVSNMMFTIASISTQSL